MGADAAVGADRTETTTSIGLFGHYRLDEEIGRGGMGVVFRAYDTRRNRIVAIKRMPRHLATDEEFRTRFQRESALAAKLREPHVVPIHDYGEIDGQLYIDMRLVEGIDLGAVLKLAPLSVARAIDVVSQVADGLDAAHEDGLVHRDVKPSNVLLVGKPTQVAERGFAYLADFGIAANLGGSTLSRPGLALGTASYMAPERMVGEPWDHRVDVYSLACVLYESVVGRRPYQARDLLGMLQAHLRLPTPRPSDHVDGLPDGFDEVLGRGMAKKSTDRYDSCGEFAAAARALLDGWTPPASPAKAPATAPSTAPPAAGPSGSPPPAVERPVTGTATAAPPLTKTGSGSATGATDAPATRTSTAGTATAGTTPRRSGPVATTGPAAAPMPPTEAMSGAPTPPTVRRDGPPTGDPRPPAPTGWTVRTGPGLDPATRAMHGRPAPAPTAVPAVDTPPRADPPRPDQRYAPERDVRRPPRRRRSRTHPLVTIGGAVLAALALAAGTVLVLHLIRPPEPALTSVDFFPTGAAPAEIALTPDGGRAYVTNLAADTVTVLDTQTGEPVVAPIPVGDEPNSVRVAGNGRAYVSNQRSGTVSILDTATNTVVATVPVGPSVDGIAVSPDGGRLYAGIPDTGTVVTIDTATRRRVGAPIKVGDKPYGMAISADGTRLYVPNMGSDDLSVVDTTTSAVTATVPVGDAPVGVAAGPDGRLYVSNLDGGTVSVLDLATNAVVATVAVGRTPVGVAVSGDGRAVYIACADADTVRVLTPATGAVSEPVAVGAGPVAIAVAPDRRVLVVGERANAVSVLRPGPS